MFTVKKKPEYKAQLTNITEDNLKDLSNLWQKWASKARKIFQALGTPTINNLRAMIHENLIKNN